MKNNLRQQILNELNFILREQIEQPAEAGGAGMMSEDLDDIVEDINDSDKESIAGHSFLNLTNFGDETDEGEIAKLISFAKTVEKQEDLTDQKTINAFNKICETPLLLINRAGPVDTFFYVSCRKIGSLNTPFSVRKLVDEGDEAALTMLMNKIKGIPVPPVNVPKECPDKSEPVEKLPDGTQKCKDGTIIKPDSSPTPAPNTSPIPAPEGGGLGEQYSRSFSCIDTEAVLLWQESLGVKKDGKIGINTLKKAKQKNPTLFTAKLEEYLEIGPDKKPTTDAKTRQNGLCSYISKNKEEYKKSKKLEESKNFYDNKKLTEAKKLFNKLMKNL
jgi:hypothetical protein